VFFYSAGLSALRPTPNLEHQVSVLMSPSDRVAQLYLQAPGSFPPPHTIRRVTVYLPSLRVKGKFAMKTYGEVGV
jgi:hypothetical protein